MLHFTLSVVLLFVPLSLHAPAPALSGPQKSIEAKIFPSHCPVFQEDAYIMVKTFLEDPDWADARLETGTQALTIQQIRTLTDTTDASICQQLNQRYNQLAKRATWTDYGYRAGYFAVGNFYFAIYIREQPLDPNAFVTDWTTVIVLDHALNQIEAYGG